MPQEATLPIILSQIQGKPLLRHWTFLGLPGIIIKHFQYTCPEAGELETEQQSGITWTPPDEVQLFECHPALLDVVGYGFSPEGV